MSDDPEQPKETGTQGSTPESGAAGSPREAAPGGEVSTGHVGTPPGTIATGDHLSTDDTGGRYGSSPHAHDTFWRDQFGGRDYTDESLGYEHYRDAYRFGWESRAGEEEAGSFEDVEERLRRRWTDENRPLEWDEARPAVRDAWTRAGGSTNAATPGNPLS